MKKKAPMMGKKAKRVTVRTNINKSGGGVAAVNRSRKRKDSC